MGGGPLKMSKFLAFRNLILNKVKPHSHVKIKVNYVNSALRFVIICDKHDMIIVLGPVKYKKTDRQTDILLTEIKVITDLFVIVIREIYVHVYTRMLVC